MLQANVENSFVVKGKPLISKWIEVGLKRKKISEVYGIKYDLLRDDKITKKATDSLKPLMQLGPFLLSIFRGNIEEISSWLNSGNVAFHGLTPIDMIYMRREEDILKYLMSYLDERNKEVFRG